MYPARLLQQVTRGRVNDLQASNQLELGRIGCFFNLRTERSSAGKVVGEQCPSHREGCLIQSLVFRPGTDFSALGAKTLAVST